MPNDKTKNLDKAFKAYSTSVGRDKIKWQQSQVMKSEPVARGKNAVIKFPGPKVNSSSRHTSSRSKKGK